MTRKENLTALRDAFVSGEWKNDGSAYRLFGDTWLHVFDAYNGDMNAALAFVVEVLPKRYWNLAEWDGAWTAQIPVSAFKRYEATSEHSPARALLIAALNALIEEADE